MSGYNAQTGIYELTVTRASFLLRGRELPPGPGFWARVAALLEEHGLRVAGWRPGYLVVHATEAQVWEALTGTPALRWHQGYVAPPPPIVPPAVSDGSYGAMLERAAKVMMAAEEGEE